MISTSGLSCNSSSALDGRKYYKNWGPDCKNVFDGKVSTKWATDNEDVGSWIEIQFPQAIWLTSIKYLHGFEDFYSWYSTWYMSKFKNVSLQFSDGSKLASVLPNTEDFINLKIKYPKLTTSMRLTAETVYPPWVNGTKKSYGIGELQLFGCYGTQLL